LSSENSVATQFECYQLSATSFKQRVANLTPEFDDVSVARLSLGERRADEFVVEEDQEIDLNRQEVHKGAVEIVNFVEDYEKDCQEGTVNCEREAPPRRRNPAGANR
jgi:hypothetical protein